MSNIDPNLYSTNIWYTGLTYNASGDTLAYYTKLETNYILSFYATKKYVNDAMSDLLTQIPSVDTLANNYYKNTDIDNMFNNLLVTTNHIGDLYAYTGFTNYYTSLMSDQRYSLTGHTHTISDITDLSANYYNKTNVDNLLNLRSSTGHTHTTSNITDLASYSGLTNYVPRINDNLDSHTVIGSIGKNFAIAHNQKSTTDIAFLEFDNTYGRGYNLRWDKGDIYSGGYTSANISLTPGQVQMGTYLSSSGSSMTLTAQNLIVDNKNGVILQRQPSSTTDYTLVTKKMLTDATSGITASVDMSNYYNKTTTDSLLNLRSSTGHTHTAYQTISGMTGYYTTGDTYSKTEIESYFVPQYIENAANDYNDIYITSGEYSVTNRYNNNNMYFAMKQGDIIIQNEYIDGATRIKSTVNLNDGVITNGVNDQFGNSGLTMLDTQNLWIGTRDGVVLQSQPAHLYPNSLVTKQYLDTAISNVSGGTGSVDLSNYYNKTNVDSLLNLRSSTGHTHSQYQTVSGMAGYQTTSGMTEYSTTGHTHSQYQTISGMTAYYTTGQTYTQDQVNNQITAATSGLSNSIVNLTLSGLTGLINYDTRKMYPILATGTQGNNYRVPDYIQGATYTQGMTSPSFQVIHFTKWTVGPYSYINNIMFYINSTQAPSSGASAIGYGIYTDDQGIPKTLISELSFATGTSGYKEFTGLNIPLTGCTNGVFWIGVWFNKYASSFNHSGYQGAVTYMSDFSNVGSTISFKPNIDYAGMGSFASNFSTLSLSSSTVDGGIWKAPLFKIKFT